MKRLLYLLEVLLITALAADFYFFPSSSPSAAAPSRSAGISIQRVKPAPGARSLASAPQPKAKATPPTRRIASRQPMPVVSPEATPGESEAPSRAAEERGDEAFSPRSQLDFAVGGEYFRIDAKDLSTNASAQVLSKFSPSVSATWKLRFTKNYASLLGVNLRKDVIEPFADNNKRIQGNGTSARFYAGAERNKNGGRSRILLGREDTLYTRAPNTQSIEITRLPTPYLSLEHAEEVFRRQTAAVGFGARISAHGSSSHATFRAKNSYGGKLFLFLSHEMPEACLRGELFYNQRKTDSTIAKQDMSSTGIGLTIEWGKP